MPPDGYEALTLPKDTVERLRQAYRKSREKLRMEGVRSLSGFIDYLIKESQQKKQTA
jgi:hypothetical protein